MFVGEGFILIWFSGGDCDGRLVGLGNQLLSQRGGCLIAGGDLRFRNYDIAECI